MKAFNIVRIEHTDGWGMFRWNTATGDRYTVGDSAETMGMYEKHSVRPTPFADGIDRKEDMFCAFETLETFNGLIDKDELKYLFSQGFKVLLITVKKYVRGNYQVCYKKQDVLTTTDISSLF